MAIYGKTLLIDLTSKALKKVGVPYHVVKNLIDSLWRDPEADPIINQVGHGFSVGQAIRYTGTAFVWAQADTWEHAQTIGVVSAVYDEDNFSYRNEGLIDDDQFEYGKTYHLSYTTPGLIEEITTWPAGSVKQLIGQCGPDGLELEIDAGYKPLTVAPGSTDYITIDGDNIINFNPHLLQDPLVLDELIIYDEGGKYIVPEEWEVFGQAGHNPIDETDPVFGKYDLTRPVDLGANNDWYILFKSDSDWNANAFDRFKFFYKILPNGGNDDDQIFLSFRYDDVAVSDEQPLDYHGERSEWQEIIQKLSAFTFSDPVFNQIYFRFNFPYATDMQNYLIDRVVLQKTIESLNGKIELQENAGWVEWRYVGDATWNQLFEIPADGDPGDDGTDAFVYVAYASDASGTGWSLTPTNALKYRAEIHSTVAFTPVVGDFSGATWVKYLGDNGNQPKQVTGKTLLSTGWSLVSGLYEYDLADANITATSIVEVIPDNADIDIVIVAYILPATDSSAGSVKIYSTNEPTDDIGVTINIFETV